MKKIAVLCFSILLIAAVVFGATNTYQVTGPITEVTPNSITVEKGKEKWQIARDASTKVSGDLKVGSKVTIEYRMTATSITAKEEAKAKPAAKAKKH